MGKVKATKSGARFEKITLRSARGRTVSSQRWLTRQLNDPYVHQAQLMGYRSRAAFKLQELDDAWHFLKPGQRVVDLGAAPGGWSQVAVERIHASPGKNLLVGIDLLPIDPIPGAVFLQGDFLDEIKIQQVCQLLTGPVDVVLSDMAASTTGQKQIDHLRTMTLVEAGFDFAQEVLAPGGVFVAKTLQGGTETKLLSKLKQRFRQVVHAKPPASRSASCEMYLVAMGFRP
ncbi:MAG: RlmE family RNA methyltransferase [Alphaproteobacteria bacterium]